MEKQNTKGILLVVSGPSGTGKGTICDILRSETDIQYSISATTRPPRGSEEHGKAYFFLTKAEFEDKIQHGGLLEWARVYDNYYGTPRDFVEEILAKGQDCILEIDTQGALQVRQSMPEAVLVFIAPPSLAELRRRIVGRGTDSPEQIDKRMGSALTEIMAMPAYDYVIVNDEVPAAVAKLESILAAEKCRVSRNRGMVQQFEEENERGF